MFGISRIVCLIHANHISKFTIATPTSPKVPSAFGRVIPIGAPEPGAARVLNLE